MNIIFIIAVFIILLSIPALLIYLSLYIFSRYYKISLTLEYCGFFKFKNINFYIDSESYFYFIHIDYFQIFLIWLKLRINVKGLKSTLMLKTQYSSLVKAKPMNKYEFNDSFVIRKQDTPNKNFGILYEIKEKFNKILYENYIKCFTAYSEDEEENDFYREQIYPKKDKEKKFKKNTKIYEKKKLPLKDKLIRNFLAFFDLVLDNIEINFKLSESDSFYRITFDKGTIGIIKGLNVNKEIHFLLILNELKMKEYINIKKIKLKNSIPKEFEVKNEENQNLILNQNKKIFECLFETYIEFTLLQSSEIFVNFKLSNGFTPFGFNSFNNTIELKIEVDNTHINLSSRAISNFMLTLKELTKYKHYQEYKYSRDIKDLKIAKDIINTQEIKFKIDCSEEVLLNMIKNEIKKIKIRLQDTSINILSDNNNYLYSNINLSTLDFKKSNIFCISCDESKIKLIQSKLEFSLDDMLISSSKKSKKIVYLNKYDLIINKEILYYYIIKESYIKTTINSDLPSLEIFMRTKDLDKYIEFMFNISYSLEIINSYDNSYFFETKYIEDINEETISNISFDNMSLIAINEKIQVEINNCSFLIKINLVKNKNKKFMISFNPIYINTFKKFYSDYSSNFIIKGFEFIIEDNIKTANLNIDIDEIILLIYDDFMIEFIKFISDFLTYNLRYNIRRKHKMENLNEEIIINLKKNQISILNIKLCTIYYYAAIKDLFTLRFGDFNYVLNDNMKLPNLRIYHQNNFSIIKKKVKLFDTPKFICKFLPDINQIDIVFGPIKIDIYSFELIHPIINISKYFSFFPLWINYNLDYKYRLDEDYKVLYPLYFTKKEIFSIKFEEIIIYISQNIICSCAILQSNHDIIKLINKSKINEININNSINNEYNEKLIIRKLKEIKAHQVQIKINEFTLSQKIFFEREINKNYIPEFEEELSSEKDVVNSEKNEGFLIESKFNNINNLLENNIVKNEEDLFDLEKKVNIIYQKESPFYKKLNRISNLTIHLGEIDIYMEGIKILNLNNLKILQSDTIIIDQFDINHLNSYSSSYKTNTIFYKELKSHKNKKTLTEIFFNDINLYLNDIKVIDKISYFTMNFNKTLMAYPFSENTLESLADESPIEIKYMIYLYLENLEVIVNSLDPITGQLYNELYLRINYLALDNEKDKNRCKTELTLYYFSFGFNIDISNSDKGNNKIIRNYPLIILPLMEMNIDGHIYRLNIPRNYMNKLSENDNKYKINKTVNNNSDKSIELKSNKIKSKDLVNHYIGENKLDNFILNTQSLTIFINYHYLKIFTKIFDNLWNRSEFIQQLFKNKTSNINNNLNLSLNEASVHENIDYKKRKNKIHSYLEAKPNNKLFNKKKDQEEEIRKENKNDEKEIIKVISTIFDLKIIYLINYQDKYYSTFLYHPQVKKHGYFGFIIRLYSGICKYSINNIDDFDSMEHDKLETELNLLTITSLNENNLNDEKFFIYDKDISDLNFKDYKDSKNFNKFMEFPYSNINKYKAINNILFNKNALQVFDFFDNDLSINSAFYKELPFKFNETLIKMKDIQLKYDNMNKKELSETFVYLDDMKVTWNKMNMDVIGILIYEEILPITNSILHQLYNSENNNIDLNESSYNHINIKQSNTNSLINKKELKLEESESTMRFIINNFQICIENEITNSKVLISTNNEITFKINKVSFNEKEKSFKMELTIKNFIFYIPPILPSTDNHIINWIGFPQTNKYYLLEEKFNQIAIFPNVFIQVIEIIKNDNYKTIYDEMIDSYDFQNNNNDINNNENIIISNEDKENEEEDIKSSSTIDIKIDKLNGEFKKEYFSCFMNIIRVFIFNRGDSYAQQKMAIDAKEKDLKNYKLKEIKNKIKENLNIKNYQIPKLIKEIRFELKEVSTTLLKSQKDYLKLLMYNLSGSQIIYDDLSSKLVVNIQNCKILDLQNPRNETLLSQQDNISSQKVKNEDEISNDYCPFYKNRIEMLRFRLKDRYISIGTDSKWYVIQYLEIGILPLYLNISKSQCDFILEFFFNTDSSKGNLSDEEYKKFIDELSDEEEKTIKSEEDKIKTKNLNVNLNKPQEPFYFNNFRINDTNLNISFFFSPGSYWNLKRAKIKLNEFEKRDKFYTLAILISRFISHLKYMAIANLGNILSSFFFTSDGKHGEVKQIPVEQKLKEEEEKNKKLLFGNLYNK